MKKHVIRMSVCLFLVAGGSWATAADNNGTPGGLHMGPPPDSTLSMFNYR